MDDASAQRIAQLEADLAAARREMQDFTYTVSHDLRAPLRHIISYARLAQEDAGPQLSGDVLGFLATVTDSARNMGAMLDALLARFNVTRAFSLTGSGRRRCSAGGIDRSAGSDDSR